MRIPLPWPKLCLVAVCLVLMTAQTGEGRSAFEELFGQRQDYNNVLVTRVVSADTIIVKEDERIRLIGVNAPIPPKRTRRKERDEYGFVIKKRINPETSLEDRAYDFAKDLLEGQYVRLEFDVEKTDEEFNTLAYVFLKRNNTLVNTEILRRGLARLKIRPPNTKYEDELRAAYQQARREKRGLHSE